MNTFRVPYLISKRYILERTQPNRHTVCWVSICIHTLPSGIKYSITLRPDQLPDDCEPLTLAALIKARLNNRISSRTYERVKKELEAYEGS